MEKPKIIILIDYRSQFWLKSDYKESSFNVSALKENFSELGYKVQIIQFADLDFKRGHYDGVYVLYQSQEDPNHFYKSYISDCLYGLMIKGAILLPKFEYFKAHDNKVFMEILRDINSNDSLKTVSANYYGTYEEYRKRLNKTRNPLPKVFKLSSGAQSKNVFLLKTVSDFIRIPKKKSRTLNLYYGFVDKIKPFLSKRYPNYKIKSHNRRKFITQDFINRLKGDFKILIYGSKYFVLTRGLKPKDFKASGSGLFEFKKDLPDGLLDYAKVCFESFDSPFMGLDIAEKKGKFYLIEFQFVHFGNYTLEKSPFYYQLEDGKWNIVLTRSNLEQEFAVCIDNYIKK